MESIRHVSATAVGLAEHRIAVEPLSSRKDVADDIAKYLIVDDAGNPMAVTLVSAALAPGNVKRAMRCASEARQYLGPEGLGQPVLEPIAEGTLGGASYAVLPYCRPLSATRVIAAWQRSVVGPDVLDWMRHITTHSVREPSTDQIRERFQKPLQCLLSFPSLPAPLQEATRKAIKDLDAGAWQPRLVLMHGDFWWGNILLDTRGGETLSRRRKFVVIDWQGLLIDGYGIFDLVRLDRSTSVGKRNFLRELDWHCRTLQCRPGHIEHYVVAAHAWIALHLEHFPAQRFIEMFSGSLAHSTASAVALTA